MRIINNPIRADGTTHGKFSFNVIFALLHQFESQGEVKNIDAICEPERAGLESRILKLLFVRPSD